MTEAQLWQNPGLILAALFLLATFARQVFVDKREHPDKIAEWEEKQAKRK